MFFVVRILSLHYFQRLKLENMHSLVVRISDKSNSLQTFLRATKLIHTHTHTHIYIHCYIHVYVNTFERWEKSAVKEKMTTESNPYGNGLHLFAGQHGIGRYPESVSLYRHSYFYLSFLSLFPDARKRTYFYSQVFLVRYPRSVSFMSRRN
jgi:hypothetical protein